MRIILKEEILRLNCPGYGEQSTLSTGRARSLETYKVLLVNPTSILHLFDDGSETLRHIEAAQNEGLTSYALESDDLLNKLNDQVTVRTEQLVKFLETGGLLVYFLCRPFTLHGPNVSIDNYLWLLSLAPDQSADKSTRNMSAVAQGRNIETTSEAQDSEFFPYLDLSGLEWTTVIRTDNLTEGYTSLALAGPKKCIAAELYAGDNAGRIVFLPAPYSPDFDKTLFECANLWYQRKLGNEVTLAEVKKAIEESGSTKSQGGTARVQRSQVEAAKEEITAQDLAQMDPSLMDRESLQQASKSSQKLPAAQQIQSANRAAPAGSPAKSTFGSLPKVPTGFVPKAPSESLPKAPSGSLPKAPSVLLPKAPTGPHPVINPDLAPYNVSGLEINVNAASNTAKPATTQQDIPVAKTETGLVVPKLDQNLSAQTKVATTSDAGAPPLQETKQALNNPPDGQDNVGQTQQQLISQLERLHSEPDTNKTGNSNKLTPGADTVNNKVAGQTQSPVGVVNQAGGSLQAENLLKELEQSSQGGAKIDKPVVGWPAAYVITGLSEIARERNSLLAQVADLQERISTFDEQLKAIEEIKNVLLMGEGAQLVNACKKALILLGWNAQPSTTAESELVLSTIDKPEALVRIVRSESQTNRADLASLAESTIALWEEQDFEPKGILLSCTWANTAPGKRSLPDHPTGLIDFALKKNLCLVTTVQLLGIYRDIELQRRSAADIRQQIITTNGSLDGFTLESVLSSR